MKDISELSHKDLVNWICRFDDCIKTCKDEDNLKLFKKWKTEAEQELERRRQAKERYLKINNLK